MTKRKRRPVKYRRKGERPAAGGEGGAVVRPGAFTVAALRKKKRSELVAIAKTLGVEYERASGEKRAALGTLILYIKGLLAENDE